MKIAKMGAGGSSLAWKFVKRVKMGAGGSSLAWKKVK